MQHRQPSTFHALSLTLTASLLIGCSAVQEALDQDGETEGDSKPNQGPGEVADPPEWHCRNRIGPGHFVESDDGSDPQQLEKCPYAIASHPSESWPGKPNWLGLPNVIDPYLHGGAPLVNNQGFDLEALNALGDEELHPMYVRFDANNDQWVFNAASEEDFRSGLIGNFALWPAGGVPSHGLRPPIVTGTFGDVLAGLPTMIGHPFYSGRYNAYGMPCSSDVIGSGLWAPLVRDATSPDSAECSAFVVFDGVAPAHPDYAMYPGSEDTSIGRSEDEAKCLDNGGEYEVSRAALTAAERGGVVWLNWDELEELTLYVRTQLVGISFFDNLFVFLDMLESLGWEWNYWPLDPDYPYARWSFTGVCGHPMKLRSYSSNQGASIRTYIGCPTSMIAVLPDFAWPDDEDLEYGWETEGYCTFPYAFAPSPGAAIPGPLPEITTGVTGHGSDGFKFVHLYEFEAGELDEWQSSINFSAHPDGYAVAPANELGESITDAFDVPPLSVLMSVDNFDLSQDADPPAPDSVGLMLYVDSAISQGRILRLMFDTPDGRRLHRYVVPVYSRLSDEPNILDQ